MINLVHVITGLNVGGAEKALLRLLANRTVSRFNPSVISLLDKGTIGPQIKSLGVPVYPLGMKRGIPGPRALIDLRRLLKRLDPDVIQGWMYHGNLAATVAASSLGRRVPVLWNIRQSLYGLAKERWLTRQVIYGSAWLSRSPKIILYNSKISASQHEAMGFKAERTRIIPNGFDCNEYYPDKRMKEQVRKELEIPLNTLLIGLIARYHPMKDHSNFLRAACFASGSSSRSMRAAATRCTRKRGGKTNLSRPRGCWRRRRPSARATRASCLTAAESPSAPPREP